MPHPDAEAGVAVKICGLRRREDVRAAERAGARYAGVVLSRGFTRSVEPDRAAAILEGTPLTRVAVLVDETPEEAARLARLVGAQVAQLHGEESPEDVWALRALGPWKVWKAVRAASPADVEEALARYGGVVDALLLEGRREGIVGGGGARLEVEDHPLREPARSVTFVLAGGLTPESVGAAVERHRPDVVDVSSGVEARPGEKDAARIRAFVEAVARAGAPAT